MKELSNYIFEKFKIDKYIDDGNLKFFELSDEALKKRIKQIITNYNSRSGDNYKCRIVYKSSYDMPYSIKLDYSILSGYTMADLYKNIVANLGTKEEYQEVKGYELARQNKNCDEWIKR